MKVASSTRSRLVVSTAISIALVVLTIGLTTTVGAQSAKHARESSNGYGYGPPVCDIGDYNGNLHLIGDCKITGHVNGNVKITNGTLTVLGTVNGNIEQQGNGSVVVGAGGLVKGNVEETGDGSVKVAGTVDGNVDEKGPGDVIVQAGGLVKGNVEEKDGGSVEVAGTVDGNVYEKGPGDVIVQAGGLVKGNVEEKGPGDVIVQDGGQIKGNVEKKGDDSIEKDDDEGKDDGDVRPGNGYGDKNHEHSGPPGLEDDDAPWHDEDEESHAVQPATPPAPTVSNQTPNTPSATPGSGADKPKNDVPNSNGSGQSKGQPTAPVATPAAERSNVRPGWGRGDDENEHSGPPGLSGDNPSRSKGNGRNKD